MTGFVTLLPVQFVVCQAIVFSKLDRKQLYSGRATFLQYVGSPTIHSQIVPDVKHYNFYNTMDVATFLILYAIPSVLFSFFCGAASSPILWTFFFFFRGTTWKKNHDTAHDS